jgi:exodeoxyribonuclease VII small subunit
LIHAKALQAVKKKMPTEKRIAQTKATDYVEGKVCFFPRRVCWSTAKRYGLSWREKNVPPIETRGNGRMPRHGILKRKGQRAGYPGSPSFAPTEERSLYMAKLKTKDVPEGVASYKEAIEEVQRILQAIEGDELDIEELVALVQRASELLAYCKRKLEQANAKVELVLANLSSLDGSASPQKA